jgi:hypothetical protein
MVDALSFVVAGSILFVFWAYGVVSFVLDVKNKFVPAIRRYRRSRRAEEGSDEDEEEAREKLRQLY